MTANWLVVVPPVEAPGNEPPVPAVVPLFDTGVAGEGAFDEVGDEP
jgi:hypothetical protein